MDIRKISSEKTLDIRHKVMWPHKNIDFVRVPEDEFGIHYGLFQEGELLSIVSVFITEEEAQFRKFATLVEAQGKGYGSKLLSYVIEELKKQGIKKIWCNARVAKKEFYKKFGLKETGKIFTKEEVDYEIMELTF